MAKTLIFLAALEIEAKTIAAALGLARTSYRTFAAGSLNDCDPPIAVELYVIGMRGVHLPALDQSGEVAAIVLAGLSGGLDPNLCCGDIVIDERSDPAFAPLDFPMRKLADSPNVVATREQKAALFQSTRAAAVDMESCTVHVFAHSLGVPYVGIRSIVDSSVENLNPRLFELIDERGGVKMLKLVKELVAHPMLVVELVRLARRSRLALARLGAVISTVKLAWVGEETPSKLGG